MSKYTLFITTPFSCTIENQIYFKSIDNNLIKNCSEIVIRIGNNNNLVIYGILVSDCTRLKESIRDRFINHAEIIQFNNSRPMILDKEIVFSELLPYIRRPDPKISVKIYARGSVNLGFKLLNGVSVCDMLRNYFWENYK